MNAIIRLFFSVFLLATLSIISVGCGGGETRVVVKGKVHNNNEPLKIKEMTGGLRVALISLGENASKEPQEANVEPDGTFTVPGNQGNGIPLGKVKIVVEWKDDYPIGPDNLNGIYNEQNSKIIREIKTGDEFFDINVGKPPTAE